MQPKSSDEVRAKIKASQLGDRLNRPRGLCARELLLVTWLASNQPPSHYQVRFSSNETCEAARQQLTPGMRLAGVGECLPKRARIVDQDCARRGQAQ
jgi:hypothetical protein